LEYNKQIYDVIVIGAGPAGCTASKYLAENGLNVLLVEKIRCHDINPALAN
jgi:flavin-dependent dehydrogenase